MKYDYWNAREDKADGLILWGVSRGTAATFCALAEHQYDNVKLVILEGAIDSIPNVLRNWITPFVSEERTQNIMRGVNSAFSFFYQHGFMKFNPEGSSPLKSVEDFPEGIPVIFITSKLDTEVTCSNTENIAQSLVAKGKNDVYLLKLERSSHPNYMYDDPNDRSHYETFIHAIYKKYNLKHIPELASQGENLINPSLLFEIMPQENALKRL